MKAINVSITFMFLIAFCYTQTPAFPIDGSCFALKTQSTNELLAIDRNGDVNFNTFTDVTRDNIICAEWANDGHTYYLYSYTQPEKSLDLTLNTKLKSYTLTYSPSISSTNPTSVSQKFLFLKDTLDLFVVPVNNDKAITVDNVNSPVSFTDYIATCSQRMNVIQKIPTFNWDSQKIRIQSDVDYSYLSNDKNANDKITFSTDSDENTLVVVSQSANLRNRYNLKFKINDLAICSEDRNTIIASKTSKIVDFVIMSIGLDPFNNPVFKLLSDGNEALTLRNGVYTLEDEKDIPEQNFIIQLS